MNQSQKIEQIRKAIEAKTGKEWETLEDNIGNVEFYVKGQYWDFHEKVSKKFLEMLPLSPVEAVTVPYCCPVCGGCGTVAANFYSQMTTGTNASRLQCRACNGTGIIFSPNKDEINQVSKPIKKENN